MAIILNAFVENNQTYEFKRYFKLPKPMPINWAALAKNNIQVLVLRILLLQYIQTRILANHYHTYNHYIETMQQRIE